MIQIQTSAKPSSRTVSRSKFSTVEPPHRHGRVPRRCRGIRFGKSTLIHILGTLDHPTSGAVLFDGVDVFTWPEQKLADFRNRKIGFIFQFHNLLPEFTSLENTMMPALIRRMPKREAKGRAEKLLTMSDWLIGSRTNPASSPAENNSVWQSPGH